MLYQKYHTKLFLFNKTTFFAILICLLCMYSQINGSYHQSHFSDAPAYYYLFYGLGLEITPLIIVILSSQPTINMFSVAYHNNYYYFTVTRLGTFRFALTLISTVIIVTYIIVFISTLLFLGIIALKAPLFMEQEFLAGATMSNIWILKNGHPILFYLQLISLFSINIATYNVIGFVISIFYPNTKMSLVFSGIAWYFIMFLDIFTIWTPRYILSINGRLGNILSLLNIYHPLGELILPYIYFLFIVSIGVFISVCLIKNQIHFFDKE